MGQLSYGGYMLYTADGTLPLSTLTEHPPVTFFYDVEEWEDDENDHLAMDSDGTVALDIVQSYGKLPVGDYELALHVLDV